jgi:6-phosphogluconolactonase (cycloisomerase 2 family)
MKSIKSVLYAYLLVLIPAMVFSTTVPPYESLGSFGNEMMGPIRLAVNANGTICVTDPLNHEVNIYASNGQQIGQITDTKKPLGVDCDDQRIYVGDRNAGNVRVYSLGGDYQGSLGGSELDEPVDLEIGSNGRIYVVDRKNDLVHVYNVSDGSFVTSFGTGYLDDPKSIAIDEGALRVYVATDSGVMYIFDLDGNYVGLINGAGGWFSGGETPSPAGMDVDAERLYVVESYYGAVAVFDKVSGTFLGYIGDFGREEGLLRVPMDVVLDSNNRMLVADYNNGRITVYGLDDYTEWNISPSVINLTVYENGNPVTQDISVAANKTLNFTVTTDQPWLTVTPASGTTDATITMTVNPMGMTADSTGLIKVISDNGTENAVRVNVSVIQDYVMTVSSDCGDLVYTKGSDTMPTCTININPAGSNFGWSATTADSWIGMDVTLGNTVSGTGITVTPDVRGMGVGTHTGTVTIDAGAAVAGSPATVDVVLEVVKTGSIRVETNRAEASFEIIGSANYTGGGASSVFADVPQGRYEISFGHVSGYIRPATQEFYVRTGEEVLITGNYRTKSAINSMAAVSAGSSAGTVNVIDITTRASSPFSIPLGTAVIASGDFDGDGTDEIAVVSNETGLTIYEADGTEAGSMTFNGTVEDMTSADMNNDGYDDVVVVVGSSRRTVIGFVYLDGGVLREGRNAVKIRGNGGRSIAAGDFTGDGIADIAVADGSTIDVYDLANKKARKVQGMAHQSVVVPDIAAADLDDNGVAEIVESGKDATDAGYIRIRNADGSDYAEQIGATGYVGVVNISSGDEDGVGGDEIIAGAPTGDGVRVYKADGTVTKTITAGTGADGVRAVVGGF